MHERENALKEWLQQILNHSNVTLTPLLGDASFRRYYRVQCEGMSHIVMDSPPEKQDLAPFIYITEVLSKANIPTPMIHAEEIDQGFLLLSDLGDDVLLKKLHANSATHYYHHAMDLLITMQTTPIDTNKMALFDTTFMLKEMCLCSEWFFTAYLKLEISEQEHALITKTMEWIADQVAQQPTVFIHRDYHSRNIMLVGDEPTALVLIDYQDAMNGPLTYDLVSLLKDCYIAWPREKVLSWVHYFYECSSLTQYTTENEFIQAFDLCGLQRHIKVLGIFSRLHLRDGKSGYLTDLPLTLDYVLECTELYEELHPFLDFLRQRVSL